MSPQDPMLYRPDGADHSPSDHAPKVGDKFTRGNQEWIVTAVEFDSVGKVVLTLKPLEADGNAVMSV